MRVTTSCFTVKSEVHLIYNVTNLDIVFWHEKMCRNKSLALFNGKENLLIQTHIKMLTVPKSNLCIPIKLLEDKHSISCYSISEG